MLVPIRIFVWIGSAVEICVDTDKQFKGLFVQDKQMGKAFEAYPELMYV